MLVLIILSLLVSSTIAHLAAHAKVEPSAGCLICKSSLTFENPKAAEYAVGTNIPLLPFKTKNSWAGNIPVPDTPTLKNGSLFFWLWGQDSSSPGDDLIIWLNGGPGCSSIGGQVTENGPFLIQSSNEGPTRPNPYSFTLAADIMWVTHPVGVSYTTGDARITNEDQISEQFVLWWKNVLKVFPELATKNLYLLGESFGGTYIANIHSKMVAAGFKTYKGGMMIDPVFSDRITQRQLPVYEFSLANRNILNFTDAELAEIKEESDKCDYSFFTDKNLHYPPKGRVPSPIPGCNPRDVMEDIAYNKSDTFNVYNIRKPDPSVVDENATMSRDIFLNSTEVQTYIHVQEPGEYVHCQSVFLNDTDTSGPIDRTPSFDHSLMAQIIESSHQFYLLHGRLDALLKANGTRLALQNLTWHGVQGFAKPPSTVLTDLQGHPQAIATDLERGFRYIELFESGHKVPQDQPSFALKALLALMGKHAW
ncbi:alpha/beta-hydrolase [Meira miltonrushii]|uniref:Alpha/beta-hydrolase n=1 Tax=Meira miltonrushii TaxID=1280837 RepID=A0A316VME6_9BASI|nr:alpha/beta-hydrolase [Meira miltonrushii]PWN38480.1 alpha/beta-hydrolase [Meira miltonrushii]